MNGLNITDKQLDKMPIKQQVAIIRQNTEEIKVMVAGYKFHQRMQYVWLSVLSIMFGAGKYVGAI